jgi:hypothetical protein
MNDLMTWLRENRLPALLAGILLIGGVILGWFALSAWDEYDAARQSYAEAVAKLTRISTPVAPLPYPDAQNLANIKSDLENQKDILSKLLKNLEACRVGVFGDLDKAKAQDRPQLFQDTLRSEVTRIRNLASSKGVTIPPSFYIGLDEYENRPPANDDVMSLARQLTVLDWLASTLASRDGLILSEFDRIKPSLPPKTDASKKTPLPESSKTTVPWETLCTTRVSFRCDQTALRDLLNAISSAPYFLVIESLQLQNSVCEPPPRNTQTPSGNQPSAHEAGGLQRLPIIAGREQVNVSMKIRTFVFPGSLPAEPSAN